jgi:plasmid stability protein
VPAILVEVLDCILYDVLMPDVMERINLNVPADVRRRLRALAARQGRTEAEVARSLLAAALDQARRDEFFQRVAETYTPQRRKRDLEILRAFEKLDG